MSRNPWRDARRAWARLNGWHRDASAEGPGRPDDAVEALSALSDIGVVRRLLDQAELVAVRTARRHGRSWAEIATMLGVSRQSAWERWRDVDDGRSTAEPVAPELEEPGREPAGDRAAHGDPAAFERVMRDELIDWAARGLRRSATTPVPDVVGLAWDAARETLVSAGLVAVGADPDGPPPEGWPEAVVTDQSPEAGATVPPGTRVTLWVDRGGGSGVREPRRPRPAPKSAREARPEAADEAVG